MHKEIQALCTRSVFFRRERRSVALAGEFVRTALADWDLEQRADDIVLCVSELATNALLHGVPPGRGYRQWLARGAADGLLRVEVHDSRGGGRAYRGSRRRGGRVGSRVAAGGRARRRVGRRRARAREDRLV